MAVSRVLVGTINFSETQSNTITDLTGTKWLLNSKLYTYGSVEEEQIIMVGYAYDATAWPDEESRDVFGINIDGVNAGHLNFTSNNENFIGLASADYTPLEGGNYVFAYQEFYWQNEAYRTIEITGGDDATNPDLIAWLQANATQQTAPTSTTQITLGRAFIKKQVTGVVTDLTNTTWHLNETVDGTAILSSSFNLSGLTDSDGGETFYDSFSGNVSCEGGGSGINAWYNLTLGSFLWYDGRNLSSLSIDAPYLQDIKITGGTDVTNNTFINWLYANGTLISGAPTTYQLVPVSVMRKVAGSGGTITDLTNTTWTFNATGTSMPSPVETPYGTSLIGTLTTPDNTIINIANYVPGEATGDIVLIDENDTNLFFTRNGTVNKNTPLGTYTLNITGGTLTTNSNLINALTTYWTQVGGGSSETLQPINLFSTIEVQAPSTISFTIAGTTYQAEPNMTWTEWVNSVYNTGSFAISYSYVLSRNAIYKIIIETSVVVCSSPYTAVFVTDIIQSGATYTLEMPAGGGSND